MGQVSSSKKSPRDDKIKKNVGEGLTDVPKSQVVEIYSNADKDDEDNELSLAESSNMQEDKLLDDTQPFVNDPSQCVYKYELVRAASTSAKIKARDAAKIKHRLAMETFQGESIQPLAIPQIDVQKHTEPDYRTSGDRLYTGHSSPIGPCIRSDFKRDEKIRQSKRDFQSQTPAKKNHLNSLKVQKSNSCSCTACQSKESIEDELQSLCNWYSSRSDSCRSNRSRLMIQALKRTTGMLKEQSIMCDIQNDFPQRQRSEPDIPPSSSVVLLPSTSQPHLAKVQWEAIVPRLLNMPSNKVLYVVEIKKSKQRQSSSGNVEKYFSEGKILGRDQAMEEKCEIGSNKILKHIQQKYNVKLKTLNELLQIEPKQLMLFLTKGVLPQSKLYGTPLKIPLDYNIFMDFFLSGV